jgi:hypothetical protein
MGCCTVEIGRRVALQLALRTQDGAAAAWQTSSCLRREKFVLQVLSETAVFIKRGKEEWLAAEIAAWQRANSYEATNFKA